MEAPQSGAGITPVTTGRIWEVSWAITKLAAPSGMCVAYGKIWYEI